MTRRPISIMTPILNDWINERVYVEIVRAIFKDDETTFEGKLLDVDDFGILLELNFEKLTHHYIPFSQILCVEYTPKRKK